jgi:membrane protein DedA with SNARE-associated domain
MRTWFHWVELWGYAGVFILMALESSIVPVPSEVVMPPAAFWAAQGRMSFAGVILAGTAGSYFGSIVSYWASRWLGLPVIRRYGKFFLLPPEKLALAETWVSQYGPFGIFVARLLPVVRHLVSIPAGVLRMPVLPFSLSTTLGAGLWCTILSWFGQEVIGSHPELLESPEAMVGVIKAKMHLFLAGVFVMTVLYGAVIWFKKKKTPATVAATN